MPTTSPTPADFKPARILEVDIGQPIPSIASFDENKQQNYYRALSLVRLHSSPLGVTEVNFDESGLTPTQYANHIWSVLSAEINTHLHHDGLPAVTTLDADGLPAGETPKCQQQTETSLPLVSIIIATCNRPDTLGPCLDSLLALDYPKYEIIVVDNAPGSGTTEKFLRENYSNQQQISYVTEMRPGLGQAHNRGLAEVTAPIVAITDDDVVVDKYWLKEIVNVFISDSDVGCVTGMILPIEIEAPTQAWLEQYSQFNKGFEQQVFDLQGNRLDSSLYPYAAGVFGSGANMSFRTSVLQEMNGFDQALGAGTIAMGADDLAAFFEVVSRGYKLVYEPKAILYHRHTRDYARFSRTVYGYGVGLTAYLMKLLVDKPWRIFSIAILVPQGLYHFLNPKSRKNIGKRADYPKELSRREWKGMLYGPLAYLRSRWKTRNWKRDLQIGKD